VTTNRRAIAVMSVCLFLSDERALWSYGACQRGFKFMVG